ncbi:MAG TPA: DUF1552 domain-containing protein [Gammaproteobacteria bacterium]|nr:DUF1552 domain-containing protein [Gammaproteobacteria bacterium]
MFLAKRHLPRRTFLRGAGATLALPLLDAMIPAATAIAQTAAAPTPRMGFFYFPHGAVMDKWTPATTGVDFELPQILAPFEVFRDQMTIVSGLRNKAAEGAGVHAVNPGTWLSCKSPYWDSDGNPLSGISADQIAAREIGQATPFPSLEMCVEVKASSSGNCNPDFGCGYGSTISFRNLTQPLPMEHNPRKLFYRLFGQGDTAAEREAIIAQTGSLLDLVSDSAGALSNRIGAADRVRLDEYLDSVREIERQVQILGDQDFDAMNLPDAPAGVPAEFDDHIAMMLDLAALAWQADLTRITSFMIAAEISMLTYNQVGISEAFHPLSHHQNNPDKLARLAVIQTYHSEVFARFLEKLRNTSDGDGTLLEHSIILYGSNMSDSNLHNADPLPSAIFGRGYGRIKGRQHVAYAPDTPHANLILTLLARAGVGVEALGDSTGILAEV